MVHRRNCDPSVQEPEQQGDSVPAVAADEGLHQLVERRRLGDAGGTDQDELVARAVRRRLQVIPAESVCIRRAEQRQAMRRSECRQLVHRAAVQNFEPVADRSAEFGQKQVHDLQLLQGHKSIQRQNGP